MIRHNASPHKNLKILEAPVVPLSGISNIESWNFVVNYLENLTVTKVMLAAGVKRLAHLLEE